MKEEKYDKIVVETQVLGEKTPQSCIQKKNAQKLGDAKKKEKFPKVWECKKKYPRVWGCKNKEKKLKMHHFWKKNCA